MRNIENGRAAKRSAMDAFYADPAAMDARFQRTVLGEYLDAREGGIQADIEAEKKAARFHGIFGKMGQLYEEKLAVPIFAGREDDRTLVGIILPVEKDNYNVHLLVLNGKIDVIEPKYTHPRATYNAIVCGKSVLNADVGPEAFGDDMKTLNDQTETAIRKELSERDVLFRFSSENPAHQEEIDNAVKSALEAIDAERKARKEKDIAEQVAAFSKQIDVFVNVEEPDLESMYNLPSIDPANRNVNADRSYQIDSD